MRNKIFNIFWKLKYQKYLPKSRYKIEGLTKEQIDTLKEYYELSKIPELPLTEEQRRMADKTGLYIKSSGGRKRIE